jgi:hypothetical protein
MVTHSGLTPSYAEDSAMTGDRVEHGEQPVMGNVKPR